MNSERRRRRKRKESFFDFDFEKREKRKEREEDITLWTWIRKKIVETIGKESQQNNRKKSIVVKIIF